MASKEDIKRLQQEIDDLKTEKSIQDTVILAQAEELERAKEAKAEKEDDAPVKSTAAKDNPAIIRKTQDSREYDPVEELARILRSVGDSRDALDPRITPIIDKAPSKRKLEELAFMEELMTIRVHDTTDENQVPVPPVWNDGRVQYFIRGEEQTVKRKYVERLCRAKITTYTQREERDAQDNKIYVQVPHTALLYPFEVIEDANPRGRDWLRQIIREPQ